MARLCACGCGEEIPASADKKRIYVNTTHQARVKRERARAELSGLKAACAVGSPPPPRATPPPPAILVEDRITTACEAAACLLRSFPNAESVTIHRDGSVSVLRVGAGDESPQDAMIDMARMGSCAPSFEVR